MAARWSSESVVAEHRDLQANAMALDWRGEYTLLAGRRALALIHLDNPSEVVKKVSRTQQKYDVTAAEWNPTQSQGHTFVLAFGERAEICQWSDSSLNGTSSLRAHTRTITDLNWHRMDPHLLATCSIDTFVHIWDTREPRKPVSSLSSIAGASQVKWNKLNPNLLASGHDCDIRVWDNRKTSQPVQFISAHLSKIQGLDWSPNHEKHLVTSSNDCTVKFFDITNPRKAENFINTLSPVWRAKYTPFGEGVVTVVAPQLRRGENPLLLWAVQDVTAPVHTFVGHSDMVLEFEWRLSGPGEHQLVTWARDHSLRIWRVDQHLQRLCGEEIGLGESTDSEFISEAVTLGPVESECEGEAGRELGLLGEEQNTPNMAQENEDDARSDSARPEGDTDPSKNVEHMQRRTSVECRSTTEATSAMAALCTTDNSAGGDVSAASSVSSPQSLRSLAIAKPSPGQPSIQPSGQPMSLQQEFSLLNTSLDSSQVNSVEVVARRTKGTPSDVVEQEEEIITVKEEIIDEEEDTMKVGHCTRADDVTVECEATVKEEVFEEEEAVSMVQNDARKDIFTQKEVTTKNSVSVNVSGNHRDTNEEEVTLLQGDTIGSERNVLKGDAAGNTITASDEITVREGNNQSPETTVEREVHVQKRDILKGGHLREEDHMKEGTIQKVTEPDGGTDEEGLTQPRDTVESGTLEEPDVLEERITVQKDTIGESTVERKILMQERDTVKGIVEDGGTVKKGGTAEKKDTEQMETEGDAVQKEGTTKERKDTQQTETEGDAVQKEDTTKEKKNTQQTETDGNSVQKEGTTEKKDMEQMETEEDAVQKEDTTKEKKNTQQTETDGNSVQKEGTTEKKDTEQMETEEDALQKEGTTKERKDTQQTETEGDDVQKEGTTEKKDTEHIETEGNAVQKEDATEKKDTEQTETKGNELRKGGTTKEKEETEQMEIERDAVQKKDTTEKKDTQQRETKGSEVQKKGTTKKKKYTEQVEAEGDAAPKGSTTKKRKYTEQVETEGDAAQKGGTTNKKDTEQTETEEEGTTKKKEDTEQMEIGRDTEEKGSTTEKKDTGQTETEKDTEQGRNTEKMDTRGDIVQEESSTEKKNTEQMETEGDTEQQRATEKRDVQERGTTKEKRDLQEIHTAEKISTLEVRDMQREANAQKGGTVQRRNIKQEVDIIEKDVKIESGKDDHSFHRNREGPLDGSAMKTYTPLLKRESVATESGTGDYNRDEGSGANVLDATKDLHLPESRIQASESNQHQDVQDLKTQNPCGNESVVPHSTCIIKIQCSADDKDGVSFGESGSSLKVSFKSNEGSPKPHSVSIPTVPDTPSVSLARGIGEDFLKEEEVIHVECDTDLEIVDEPREKDEDVAVCQVVTSGSFVIKGAASSLMQVEASVVHLPESLTSSGQTPEEVWGSLAPQLLEGGVIVHGENLVLGALSLVTVVESVEVEGEPQTQITISPLAESVEAYHQRGVNFILVTKNSESASAGARCPPHQGRVSESVPKTKPEGRNAPHSDTPGQFRCDKCDKTYSVRSSLNSHRVTHNTEKMYKCDECDRAFHYSTPLMIHKRTHSDERPYHCQTCLASFKSMTNLRCHQRQHSGERPIICPDCNRGFRDYTSLKRHRQRMHKTGSSGSSDSATSPQKDKVSMKSENENTPEDAQGQKDKTPGAVGRLSDYVHRCGLCQMTCHTRPQMLTHLQVHAAAERFRCRYCPSAYTFRFLLARHVREHHPGRPQWFCQHCDRIFDTCRKMNSHSCRSVRGNYSCPHNCGFTTEVRHRVFRHIARHHPEDAAPYHCDFCSNRYRDPGRLRYHQKRQHPEKMADLAPPPKDTWRALSESGAEDKGAVDMSQVEVSVVDGAIEYFLPEDLRNDVAFRERVKFKCFYCEAKFPVKNAMTRHVLRAHPGQRAYKCLRCNVFFRSNTESKNHNRKYHKYRDTGGRDPQRNEKAMRKRAQAVEEQLRHATPSLRSAYKFRCLHCPMAYRCKRPLVAHYRRWHPDQEWDHLPDRPAGPLTSSSSKRRKLMFFDCVFEPDCGRTFDELELCLEHLLHAHEVSGDAALPHVKERMVVEGVRRGRLPKNAVVVVSGEAKGYGNEQKRQQWWKRRKRTKSEIEEEMMEEEMMEEQMMEEEEDFDEEMDDLEDEDEFDMEDGEMEDEDEDEEEQGEEQEDEEEEEEEEEDEMLKIKSEDSIDSSLDSEDVEESKLIPELSMKLEDIDSVGDVKKMLYRCRKCGMSCSSKAQYREHSASHTHSKEQLETQKIRKSVSPEKVPVLGTSKKSQLPKSEPLEGEGGIQVTSLREEVSEGEDDIKVLTLTPSASGPPVVKVDNIQSGAEEDDVKPSKAALIPPQQSQSPSSLPATSPQKSLSEKSLSSPRSASNTRGGRQGIRKERPLKGQVPKEQPPKGQHPKAQPSKGQPPKEQSPKEQHPKGQPPKGQPPKGQPPKGQPSKGQPPKGQSPKGQPSKGQPPKVQPSKGQSSKGQLPKEQPSKGQLPKEQPSKGQPLKKQAPKVQPPKVQPPKKQPLKGQSPKRLLLKGQPLKEQSSEVVQQETVGKRKAVGQSRMAASTKLQCPECFMSFKTRSEMSFHKRLDH